MYENAGKKNLNAAEGRILVTSGPTRAYIDDIRYISNTSSGKLGSEIVRALIAKDIPVTHLYGVGSEYVKDFTFGLLESECIVTIDNLVDSIRAASRNSKIRGVIHAMAVLDYVPDSVHAGKKKSGDDAWDVHLVKMPKVITLIRELLPDAFIAGFKLEKGVTEQELIDRASNLIEKSGCDIVVANDLDKVSEYCHDAIIIDRNKNIISRAHSKSEIAEQIADIFNKQ